MRDRLILCLYENLCHPSDLGAYNPNPLSTPAVKLATHKPTLKRTRMQASRTSTVLSEAIGYTLDEKEA